MAEHPILFSTPMVKAILENRKTQTRRVQKPQMHYLYPDDDGGVFAAQELWDRGGPYLREIKCPYGQPGDLLWVREAFAKFDGVDNFAVYQGGYDSTTAKKLGYPPHVIRKSDGAKMSVEHKENCPKSGLKWKPSIFMPRTACRLFLEITDIQVQKLRDIGEAGSKAEGVSESEGGYDDGLGPSYRRGFAELWDKLNAKRGFGWSENPWVWVITFRKSGEKQ